MHARFALAAFAIFALLPIPGRAADPVPPPGGIKLLPGYQHQKLQGIDTRVGKISKEGGLAIEYDIGRLAGNYAKGQDKAGLLWFKEQVVGGRSVQLAFTKDRTLIVTFPETHANFSGKTKSDEDLADMLLMVLSYAPEAKAK
jgi:hypothetical protein